MDSISLIEAIEGIYYFYGNLYLYIRLVELPKYHTPDTLNNRNLFAHNPEGWKSKIKMLIELVSPKATLCASSQKTWGKSSCCACLALVCLWFEILIIRAINFPTYCFSYILQLLKFSFSFSLKYFFLFYSWVI